MKQDRLIDLPGGSGTETFEDKEESDFLFDICLTQQEEVGFLLFFDNFRLGLLRSLHSVQYLVNSDG